MEVQTSGKPIDTLIERVLGMNILSSDYFKELYKLKTYHEVIDEIYEHVDHVEPWMTGNCRGPSTAFCLLYKFFTMKLTVKQMHGVLKHPDSPYIRAIGFLYLRYAGDPKALWNWFEPYVKDEEEFSPGSNGRMTTMGAYVRDLLLGQITANLERMKLPSKHSGVTGETTRHGSDDTARRPPSVKAALSVSFGQRAPHRASTRDSSPVRRTLPPPRERSRSREGPDHDRDHDHDHDRGRDRERDKDRDRDRGRDPDRDRDRDRDRERRYDYDRRRSDRDSRGRDSHRSRYSERDNGKGDYKRSGRDSERRRESSSRHSRSRSRSRSRSMQACGTSSDRRPSPFGEKAAAASSNLAKLKDLYGDASDKKWDAGTDRLRKDSSTEEVIRLGGSSWK